MLIKYLLTSIRWLGWQQVLTTGVIKGTVDLVDIITFQNGVYVVVNSL